MGLAESAEPLKETVSRLPFCRKKPAPITEATPHEVFWYLAPCTFRDLFLVIKQEQVFPQRKAWRLRREGQGFPGGPLAKTPSSQSRERGFDPWLGKQIPQAATKSSHAPSTDISCHRADQRS